LVVGLCVVGCSDDGGSQATRTTALDRPSSTEKIAADARLTGACQLLTVDDVTATGLIVVEGPAPDEAVRGDECVFKLTTVEGSVVPGRVAVTLFTPEQGPAIAPALFPDHVMLSGVADEAWTSGFDRLAGARLSDGRVVTVQIAATGPEAPISTLVTLLTAAVGRT
jgi:hypothetical protein